MLTVTLPYPVSANRYWRVRVVKGVAMTYVSAEAKSYKADVATIVRAAGARAPLAGRIAIDYTLFPKRPQDWQRRARKLGDAWHDDVMCLDLDNAQKVLLDALKGVAFEDDKWVRRISASRAEPDGEARIVVRISQIGTPQPQAALDLPAVAPSLFDPLGG
ncbi:Crossover junction endodeoxyribonuclease RusA [Caballeronia peredens]|nr:Crossover junction endodeoxyribonuclease RusA [Caballeronia peredens]